MAKRGETAKRGESVLDLIEVMDRLRSPGGCPWDARQTHESLVEYLVEEAYETVEEDEIVALDRAEDEQDLATEAAEEAAAGGVA